MTAVVYKNPMNNESVICEDPRNVKLIDGEEYLLVHRPQNSREFFMRKQALVKDGQATRALKTQNFSS